jgi:DNA processing protein
LLRLFSSLDIALENIVSGFSGFDTQKEEEMLRKKIQEIQNLPLQKIYAGIDILFYEDEEYPEMLKNIYNPPVFLFIKGEKNLLQKECFSVVGTRNASAYGRQCVDLFVPYISKKRVIVSGLATGIDGLSHRACLEHSGKTIAVLANGLDTVYPVSHKNLAREILETGGCLVSETPCFEPIRPYFFIRRNRIIAGLSGGLLLIEAKEKSGSLHTARFAFEQNKNVFTVPHSLFFYSCRGGMQLVKNNIAELVLSPQDIFPQEVFPQDTFLEQKTGEDLLEEEKNILACISEEGVLFDELCFQSGVSSSSLNMILGSLELKKYIFSENGLFFKRIVL